MFKTVRSFKIMTTRLVNVRTSKKCINVFIFSVRNWLFKFNFNSDDDKPQQTLDERLAEIMMSQEDDHNDKDSVKVS